MYYDKLFVRFTYTYIMLLVGRLLFTFRKPLKGYGGISYIGVFSLALYITHIYSGEKDKCSALVTRNNKIKLLEHGMIIIIMIKLQV